MKKLVYVLVSLVIAAVFGVGGFFIGRNTVNQVGNSSASTNDAALYQTFYAEIEENNGQSLLVKGLDVNDVNSRGEFYVAIDGETILEWRYEPISLEELEVGDTVSITHTGNIGESYPAQIFETVRIQLLDDEK
ncbi:hypothetical protein [uncultured Ruminococcus sp.]|uniref:hypothetical protein n=1 Tax=uncultured Ruminococcus sp. TaxID=165186 RepID=UPI0026020BB9|nr:hypothetical protein [uncultured Ruminococcus sp.]